MMSNLSNQENGSVAHLEIETDSDKKRLVSEGSSIWSSLWTRFSTFVNKNKLMVFAEMPTVIIVFSVALWYFNGESSVSLITTTRQNECSLFESVYTLQTQNAALYLVYEIYIPSYAGQPVSEMNHSIYGFQAFWRSCSEEVSSFSTLSLATQSSDYLIFDYGFFNFSTTAVNEVVATTTKSYNATFVDAAGKTVLNVDRCFDIGCLVLADPVITPQNVQLTYGPPIIVPYENTLHYPSGVVTATLSPSPNGAASVCSATVYGIPLPYFSASSTMNLSPYGLCTKYYSALSTLGLSLPFALTSLSLWRMFGRFSGMGPRKY